MQLMPVLFGLLFVAIGAGFILLARRLSAEANASVSWPSVPGQISHSGIDRQTIRSNNADGFSRTSTVYKADIGYSYEVKGRPYAGSRIKVSDVNSSSARAQEIVMRYPDKSAVKVYYDPANPSRSVLEPGKSSGSTLVYAVGSLFAAGGLLFAVMGATGHMKPGVVHVHPNMPAGIHSTVHF